MLTTEVLQRALGIARSRADVWVMPMREACALANINTVPRMAAWLGQIGHETMRLRFTAELWGPTAQQLKYELPNRLARTLGNTQPGDGRRFAGHGCLQITGRANHARVRDNLRRRLGKVDVVPDFEAHPQQLATPRWAALSAADYWISHGLNQYADAHDITMLTRRINGGLNGLADRQALTAQATAALILEGHTHA